MKCFEDLPYFNCYHSYYLKMRRIKQENLNQQSERITFLLAELNSTLDLYDENSIDTEIDSNEP